MLNHVVGDDLDQRYDRDPRWERRVYAAERGPITSCTVSPRLGRGHQLERPKPTRSLSEYQFRRLEVTMLCLHPVNGYYMLTTRAEFAITRTGS